MSNQGLVLLTLVSAAAAGAPAVCPNPPAPDNFDLKRIEGRYYDYLSTAEYDAQTYCVTAQYTVVGDALNITVDGWHNGPPNSPGSFEKQWSLLLHNTGNNNPSQFEVTAASMPGNKAAPLIL